MWLPFGGAVGDQAGDGHVGLVEVFAQKPGNDPETARLRREPDTGKGPKALASTANGPALPVRPAAPGPLTAVMVSRR